MHKYSNLSRAGIELGTLWSEGRDLTNCANQARAEKERHVKVRENNFKVAEIYNKKRKNNVDGMKGIEDRGREDK